MIRFATIAIITLISFVAHSQKDSAFIHFDSTHSPKKATLMSIALPGLGQIYNDIKKPDGKKSLLWWKLPIVYGGLGASTYFVIQNQKEYKFYREERIALKDNDSTLYSVSGFTDSQLKSIYDQYARWRDLSIVAGLVVYVLNIVDANVSGNLLHFDSSDDLSFDFQPKVFYSNQSTYTGLSLCIHFKDKNTRKDLSKSIFIK